MTKPLRVLNVEDSERDVTLLSCHLVEVGYELSSERVETAEAMNAALLKSEWDVILCDYSMPRFNALSALKVLRESGLDIPFIIISGTIGEDVAVKSLLSGANDYIFKGNLTRLKPAIERELQQAEERRVKRTIEEALKASEAELRAIFAAMNDIIIVFDYDGHHLKVAPTNPEHFYKHETNRIGKTVHEIYPPDFAQFLLTNIQICLDESRTLNLEYSLAIEGVDMWFHGTVTPMTDASALWVARNVTATKRVQEDLRESEEKFSGAFEHAPIGIALLLPDGRWLKLNRAICDMLGYAEAELMDLTFRDITHPDDLEEDLRQRSLLFLGKIPYFEIEKRYIHKQGHDVFVCVHASLMRHENGDPRYFILQIQDITDRKADERQLELHSLLLNSIGQAVIVTDSSGHITYWNKLAEKMYGWTSAEVQGRNIAEITPTNVSRPQGVEILETLMRGESWSGEFTVQNRNGVSFPIFVTNTPLLNANGQVESIIGISHDITDRKHSERALFESEERYRDLVENASDIIFTHDLEGNYTSANKAVEIITGYTTEEVLSMNFSEQVAPEHKGKPDHMLAARLCGTNARADQIDVIARDGHRVTLEVNTRAILENGSAVGVQGIARDITDRKRAYAELEEKSALLEAQLNSSIDGILVVDEDGRQVIQNQRFVDLFNIPESIASDPDNSKQVRWVTGVIKYPDKFVEKVVYLSSHPDEVSRDEIELTDGTFLDRYSAPVKGKDNKHYGRIWTFRDITERKRSDDALRESETRLRTIINTEPECVKLLARDGSLLEMNPAGLRMIEADSFDEVANSKVADLVDMQYRRAFRQLTEKVFRGQSGRLEFQLTGLKGNRRWLDTHASPLRDGSGNITALLAITLDVTESKRGTEALADSEERYRSVVNTAPDVIVTIDHKSTICFINPAAERIFGYDIDELKGASLSMLMPERLRHLHDAGFQRYLKSGVKHASWDLVEVIGLHKSGREIPITISFSEYAQNDRRYFTGIIRDISERKLAMEALRESQERYRELVENAIDIIYTHDLKGNYTSVNKAAETITGYTNAEVLAMNIADTIPADQVEKAKQMIAAQIAGEDIPAHELEIIAKDGHKVPVEINARIVYENSVPVGIQGIARDITERKAAEAARLASERKYQALFTLAPVGIYQSLPDGSITTANTALAHMLGYDSADELLEKDMGDVYFERDGRRTLIDKYEGRGYATDIDLRWKKKDGSPMWIQLTAHAVKSPTGETEYFEGFVRDITERKASEKEIERTMERLNAAQRIGKIGDWTWDKGSGTITWSREIFTIVGRDPELGPPNSYEEQQGYYCTDSRVLMGEKISLAIETGEAQDYELIVVRSDGMRIHAQAMCEPQTDDAGQILGVRGTLQDISARQKAELALRESEFRYHSLFENMLEGYAYCQTIFQDDRLVDFVYTEVNGAFNTLTGLTNVIGKKVSEVIPGLAKTNPEFFESYGRVALSGEPEKFETYVEQLGILLSITVYSSSRESFVAVFDNITERKRAEASVAESQEQLRLAAESVNLGIWDWDIVDDRMEWDERMYELYGIRADEFGGAYEAWQKGLHPDDREEGEANIRAAQLGERQFNTEFRVIWPNGEVRNIEARALVERDDAGNALRMIGVNWDITERKRAEAALEAAEENYRSIFKNAVEGIFQSTNEGRFISANPAMARILGFDSPEELIELRDDIGAQHYVDPETRDDLSAILEEHGVVAAYECEVYKKDGTKIWTQENIRAIRGTDGVVSHCEGSMEDITARKSLEEQFRQSQKMEAVGVLAGGIAHDFNNLLTAINGYSDLTLRQMPSDEPLRRNIEEVKKAGDRAAELTNQLLAFSRKQVLKIVVNNPNTAIESIERMLRRIIRENVEVRTILDPELGNIKADPGQVEQVIMNLAINACDAMPDGGTLTIETENVYLDKEYVSQNLAIDPGPFAKITITDTGIGMGEATQQHIFEPFFTTKKVGQGTGLGLSMVYGIVKQSGGDIVVYSEPGYGTTFKIYIPCVDEPIEKPRSLVDDDSIYAGTETILVVEDEEIVRSLVCEILMGSGYVVLEAASGEEALEVCSSYTEPIHLLLTDVIMPNMGGSELCEHVVKLLPEIKVIFMSGYTDDTISHRSISPESNAAFIEKPFTPDALARKIRDELER